MVSDVVGMYGTAVILSGQPSHRVDDNRRVRDWLDEHTIGAAQEAS